MPYFAHSYYYALELSDVRSVGMFFCFAGAVIIEVCYSVTIIHTNAKNPAVFVD